MVASNTILVVEDDPQVLRLEKLHLDRAGYTTRTASTADEALSELRREPIDLILLDYGLPGEVDGLGVYDRAKKAGFNPPAILVTGFGDEALVSQALRAGIRDYIAKTPGYLNRLPETVERVLREIQAEPSVEAERALRRSEQHFRQVWERSLDAMRVTDGEGTILQVNTAYCQLVGKPRERLEGQLFSLGYAEEERAAVLARYREDFAARQTETMALRSITLWDGRKVHLEFSSSFLDVAGEPLLLLSIIRDISPRVLLEEQLRRAQKMEAVGRLAGGVAHDFNNLLTAINGYSQLIYDSLPATSPERNLLAEVIKAGERAAGLTRQLLTFSRKEFLAPRVLDLNAIVRELSRLLRRLIGEDVQLTAVTSPNVWPIMADPSGVEQVIVNLAVNARDAMAQGGQLTIETNNVILDEEYTRSRPEARPGPHVLLAVTDTGCGMDAATLSRIFEPFFTTKGEKGTGLGLATVYGIVKQSGGHVGVYSEPGRGTSFQVYFPKADDPTTPGEQTVARFLPRGNETLLLVEDDPGIRALGEQVLRSCGYQVLTAGSGREALEVAGKYTGQIDLLVTDVVMPHLGGGQLAEELSQQRPGLKVLYLSGYTADAVVRHGVLEEKAAFLHKPFSLAALTQKVREVLDGGEQRQ